MAARLLHLAAVGLASGSLLAAASFAASPCPPGDRLVRAAGVDAVDLPVELKPRSLRGTSGNMSFASVTARVDAVLAAPTAAAAVPAQAQHGGEEASGPRELRCSEVMASGGAVQPGPRRGTYWVALRPAEEELVKKWDIYTNGSLHLEEEEEGEEEANFFLFCLAASIAIWRGVLHHCCCGWCPQEGGEGYTRLSDTPAPH